MSAAAFVLGLLSSLHCIGMCGPIALMLPVDRANPAAKITQLTAYHLGRISTYAALGALFGFAGKALFLAGMQQRLSVVAGMLMIVTVLAGDKVLGRFAFASVLVRWIGSMKADLLSRWIKKSARSFFFIGMLNGLLPCALVYSALFGAMGAGSVAAGAGFMIVFGLGTVPLMLSVNYLGEVFPLGFRAKIVSWLPLAVGFLGVLFVIRGLGLGIPFLSPSEVSLMVMGTPDCR